MYAPLKFGSFIPPYHKVGLNPTLALRRSLDLVKHLDELGYAEAWFGEHHSGGVELVASPELMIAAAAEQTRQIKLGTGVSSLPYHHPFMLADRIIQLDHLTRGRMMFGVGPGQLVADARMMGIEPATQRDRMHESLNAILRLFDGETVTETTDWYELHDAKLQLSRYSDFEVAVTAAISPSGPRLAGRHGTALLSLAATDPAGVERLGEHWTIAEEEAAKSGKTVNRSQWRLVGMMHVAETMEQAIEDVSYGLRWVSDYLWRITPTASPGSNDIREAVAAINASGRGVIGTPDMAAAQIQRLLEKSGGFGTYLFQAADYARWDETLSSYRLFAEEVMPRFTGQLDSINRGYEDVMASGSENAEITAAVQKSAQQKYGAGARA